MVTETSNYRIETQPTRRPCFRCIDRLFWILLSRWWSQWGESLVIIRAETVALDGGRADLISAIIVFTQTSYKESAHKPLLGHN